MDDSEQSLRTDLKSSVEHFKWRDNLGYHILMNLELNLEFHEDPKERDERKGFMMQYDSNISYD